MFTIACMYDKKLTIAQDTQIEDKAQIIISTIR